MLLFIYWGVIVIKLAGDFWFKEIFGCGGLMLFDWPLFSSAAPDIPLAK